MIGNVLQGRYHLQRQISPRGRVGIVYRAFDLYTKQRVAVKVFPIPAGQAGPLLRRFARDTQMLASLRHPNIVAFGGSFAEGENYCIVMEYMDGGSLESLLSRGRPLPLSRARQIAFQIGEALATAHDQGIIHRDIKASNILLNRRGEAKICDFDIARPTSEDVQAERQLFTFGTAAPEVLQGGVADQRSDVYSFGIVLFQMLTGHLPFVAENDWAVAYMHTNTPPPSPRSYNSHLSPALDEVVLKALAKAPADRYQRMDDLLVGLERAFGPHQPSRGMLKATWRVIVGAAAFIAVLALAMQFLPDLLAQIQGPTTLTKTGTGRSIPAGTGLPAPTATVTKAVPSPTLPAVAPTATPVRTFPPTPRVLTEEPATPAMQTPTPAPILASQTTCPPWFAMPESGKGILLIENHTGGDLTIEQIGTSGQVTWRLAAKQGDVPGRLLLQLHPGVWEFMDYSDDGWRGHIRVQVEEGKLFVSPIWHNDRYDEHVYPMTPPPGCG
ncbi:MAG: protein kinase [Anaerolineae bacterium]|nr:protein kinase [Anaerolineae bacterium]